jgi:hypothetical protein
MTRVLPAFETERQLQAVLGTHAALLGVSGPNVRLRREMPVGTVIPDLVLVSFDRVPAQSILRLRWSYPHAHVVAELRRFPHLRRDTIAERMFDRRSRVDRLLDELIDVGALEVTATESIRLSDELRSMRTQIVAVEAKLSRWTEALDQALAYNSFADRSFVAMDATRIDGSPRVADAFKRVGIGLILVDLNGARCVHAGREDTRVTAGKEYLRFSALGARTQTLWMRR